MERYCSHSVELNYIDRGIMRAAKDTLSVFRAAVSMVGDIAIKEWGSLEGLSSTARLTAMERLIHTTKKNTAHYPVFDREFYKFPSYCRRSVINFACGQVASYKTRLEAYEKERYEAVSNGRKFKKNPPVLNLDTNVNPVMYQKEMYTLDLHCVRLKLFIRGTWDWVEVNLPTRGLKNLIKSMADGGKLESPSLVLRYHKLYLDFPIQFPSISFPKTPLEGRRMLGVDLGVNNGAVCSVMDACGTIEVRAFDPFTSERDRLNHLLNRLRKVARASGTGQPLSAFYTKLDGVKANYARQLSHWIVDTAHKHGVYGIVMENLGRMKPKRKKDKIHHWCKKKIYSLTKGIAMRYGIRVFLINPKNTSALAFDGSGRVERNWSNDSLCTFKNGKRYHADLNASYNIAARYFIREYKKSMPETAWSECMAKVPALSRRTDCTLSTLRELCACKTQAAARPV